MPIKSIKEEIDHFVTKVMFHNRKPPDATNSRYFPDISKILNLKLDVYRTYVLQAPQIGFLGTHFQNLKDNFGAEVTFEIDHVDLQNTELKDLKIQKIYLLYQSKAQQYLLNKYGMFVHLTEVKPQKGQRPFGISFFLICVRTNVDYQVVGTILCNKYNDHAKVLKEALTEFKEINEFWKPKYLVIDPSEAMESVVKEIFPGTVLFESDLASVDFQSHNHHLKLIF